MLVSNALSIPLGKAVSVAPKGAMVGADAMFVFTRSAYRGLSLFGFVNSAGRLGFA